LESDPLESVPDIITAVIIRGSGLTVIACDKREAFAQGSAATKQSILAFSVRWIASLRSQ
jgi:hypothetical protein